MNSNHSTLPLNPKDPEFQRIVSQAHGTSQAGGVTCAYLTPAEAAEYLGLSVPLLAVWRQNGRGPAFSKLTRAVRYRRSDLDLWMGARRVDPAPENGEG